MTTIRPAAASASRNRQAPLRILPAALAVLLASACAGQAEAPDLPFGAQVRIVSQRLGPGWHRGSMGMVGDCVVVMIPEPPVEPVRLHTIDFTDITEVEMGDSSAARWTPVRVESLRAKHGGCL
jgi:hypothetical protein